MPAGETREQYSARMKAGRRVWANHQGWKFYLAVLEDERNGKPYLELWSEELGHLRSEMPSGKSVDQLTEAEIKEAFGKALDRAGFFHSVGELREFLRNWPDDFMVYMGGLTVYRMKQRGDKIVQMEFNQQVWHDQETGAVIIENVE